MRYTAAHWGIYRHGPDGADPVPLPDDPVPSRVGRGWASAMRNRDARILAPMVRRGWLAGDGGAGRCDDAFVEVGWDRALDLAAAEVARVRAVHGNAAIFGGSYGWSSAGRFHHAQGQMRRFLALAGGFASSRDTYSHAAAEVLFPHVLGMDNNAFQDRMTTLPLIEEHCEVLLAFGGIAGRTAQIASAGTATHEITPWLRALRDRGVRMISVAPERGEALGEWWPVRPGSDTALILGLIHGIVTAGREDRAFLDRCTSGWEVLRDYVLGHADGVAKSAAWAAALCDIPADRIADLARTLTERRSMVAMTWGMQRADHGEQPIWAGLALACVLGQIGRPGTGYAFGYGSTTPVGRGARLIPWPSLPKAPNPVADFIPVARIADMLLEPGRPYAYNGGTRLYPDTRLVWWSGGNPFHHHQDLRRLEEAWTRPETVIVNDHSWTATARRADIVLPATTPLERDDLMMNRRDPTLLYMSATMDPMGAARDDFDIFSDLADRLGIRDAFTEGRGKGEWLAHLWAQARGVARDHGVALPPWDAFRATGRFDVPDARESRIALEAFVRDPAAAPLGTESGRITLFNRRIAAMALPDCPGHPAWLPPVEGAALGEGEFHLISGQPDTRLHSQNDMGSESLASKCRGREVCTLHPDTARGLGVSDGDILRLWNARGACLAGVRTDAGIRADCLSLPTGAWYDPQRVAGAYLEVHGNPNALTMDKGCSALSQGNIAHTCTVRAEKWRGPLPELTVTKPPPVLHEEPVAAR